MNSGQIGMAGPHSANLHDPQLGQIGQVEQWRVVAVLGRQRVYPQVLQSRQVAQEGEGIDLRSPVANPPPPSVKSPETLRPPERSGSFAANAAWMLPHHHCSPSPRHDPTPSDRPHPRPTNPPPTTPCPAPTHPLAHRHTLEPTLENVFQT